MDSLSFSIIIPTYNRAKLVGRAIRSALAAKRADDEILVVDDGSTDGTQEVVASFGDQVRFLPMPHAGAGPTRNAGIDAATRPLIAFLDSDDEWSADKLTLQRTLMERRPDVLFCFSDMEVPYEGSDRVDHNFLKNWHHDDRSWDEILGPGAFYSTLAPLPAGRPDFRYHIGSLYLAEMLGHYVVTSTLVVRREDAGTAFRFASDLKISEDKVVFACLAKVGQACYFDCETARQWGHTGARITDSDPYDVADARLKVMERVWGADPDFLAKNQAAYDKIRREQHLIKARYLIARGRSQEARAELRLAGNSPFSYRFSASIPGPILRGLLSLKRRLKSHSS